MGTEFHNNGGFPSPPNSSNPPCPQRPTPALSGLADSTTAGTDISTAIEVEDGNENEIDSLSMMQYQRTQDFVLGNLAQGGESESRLSDLEIIQQAHSDGSIRSSVPPNSLEEARERLRGSTDGLFVTPGPLEQASASVDSRSGSIFTTSKADDVVDLTKIDSDAEDPHHSSHTSRLSPPRTLKRRSGTSAESGSLKSRKRQRKY